MIPILRHGFTAAFALAGFASAAEPPAPEDNRSILRKLNPFAEKPPAPVAPKTALPVGPVVKPVGPLSADTMLDVLRDEQEAYTRRLEVCTQLRLVAVEKRDEKLLAQIDEMEKMAEITFKTRLSRLGVKSQLRTTPNSEDAERSFGSHLRSSPIPSGVRTPDDARPATAQIKNFREVKQ